MRFPRAALFPVLALKLLAPSCHAADPLADGFAAPPDSAKPQAWWHWMDGNVSREGITADLEAMARVGLGGVQKFDLGGGSDNLAGPVRIYSPEYAALMRHAVSEAARLGLEFGAHNCPGFSASGGPWVPKEEAMKTVTFTETHLTGGQPFAGPLPTPPAQVAGTYRDIAVYAYRVPEGAARTLWDSDPRLTSSVAGADLASLRDAPPQARGVALKAKGNWSPWVAPAGVETDPQGDWVRFDFAQPLQLRSFRILGRGRGLLALEASDDGATFRVLATADQRMLTEYPAQLPQTLAFPATTARAFRLRIASGSYQLARVTADDAAVVHDILGKAAFTFQYEMTPGPAESAPAAVIDPSSLVNLTDRLAADGQLAWTPPPGRWTVLRIGYASATKNNHPAEAAGQGFECDKLSRAAVTHHLENALKPLLAAAGDQLGRTFTNVLFDSYEAGSLNWTPGLEAEFKTRRGYDPLPWLPVLTGRIVQSTEASERFLWDFRRTIGDLLDENYFATTREILQRHGLAFALESYGNVWGEPFDTLRVARHADIVMNEFWGTGRPGAVERVTGMPDAGHVHGIRIVGAEAFTAAGGDWTATPFDLKAWGDRMFARGVNRFYFHASPHQPWADPRGGVWFVPLYLHRGNTWFTESGDYLRYLARCQFLLQAGRPSADIAYCYGEDTPLRLNSREPAIPAGYRFDACPADLVVRGMTVADNGDLLLPSGMRYRVLLLPPDPWMTPELLAKVDSLVRAGATVLGRRPERSPSRVDQPRADETVRRLAASLWPESDALGAVRTVGKGRVVNAWDPASVASFQHDIRKHHQVAAMDAGLARILPALEISPDFTWGACGGDGPRDAEVNWIRRRLDDGGDVYFVANGNNTPRRIEAEFRVDSRLAPQLWFPETGQRRRVAAFNHTGGRTRLELDLEPAGSVFVVFRAEEPALPAFEKLTPAKTEPLAGPWTVTFQPNRGAPDQPVVFEKLASLTERPEFGVKYFSGTATYRTTFRAEPPAARLRLDLGAVQSLAGVTLNGRNLGTLWKPPFVVDLGDAVRAGENTLEIRVTTTWHNRMVGDEQLPNDGTYGPAKSGFGSLTSLTAWPEWWTKGEPRPTGRVFFSPHKFVRKDTPLKPAGLLGPVKLEIFR